VAPQDPIYLDNHATTRVDPRVVEAMAPFWSDDYGNAASAAHVYGWRAEEAVEQARAGLAAGLGADPREIVFTSGATESNNLALLGAADLHGERRDHVVTVATEHSSVLDPARALGKRGFEVSVLPVDAHGRLDPDEVSRALGPRTLLVSVMAANNEIGVLQDVAEIGARCREAEVLFHCDAVQAFGKVPVDVEHVDLLSLSAHKIYGPKGVGLLYVRRRAPRVRLAPRVLGGGHERGLRSGTLPVPLIVGFARAAELCLEEREAEARRLAALRDGLLARLREELEGVALNGDPERRLPANLNVAFEGVDADQLLVELSDVALSTGSACTSAVPGPSHVLAALGHSKARVRSSVRIGLGRFTTAEEVERAAGRIIESVQLLRSRDPRKSGAAPLPSAGSSSNEDAPID
jgi:cysteine desulfurase